MLPVLACRLTTTAFCFVFVCIFWIYASSELLQVNIRIVCLIIYDCAPTANSHRINNRTSVWDLTISIVTCVISQFLFDVRFANPIPIKHSFPVVVPNGKRTPNNTLKIFVVNPLFKRLFDISELWKWKFDRVLLFYRRANSYQRNPRHFLLNCNKFYVFFDFVRIFLL